MRKFWRRKPPRPIIMIEVKGQVGPDLADQIKAAVRQYELDSRSRG